MYNLKILTIFLLVILIVVILYINSCKDFERFQAGDGDDVDADGSPPSNITSSSVATQPSSGGNGGGPIEESPPDINTPNRALSNGEIRFFIQKNMYNPPVYGHISNWNMIGLQV